MLFVHSSLFCFGLDLTVQSAAQSQPSASSTQGRLPKKKPTQLSSTQLQPKKNTKKTPSQITKIIVYNTHHHHHYYNCCGCYTH